MKRRQLVTGLGALVGGGGLFMGTGAFTSVEADRDASVKVADENQAYLRIFSGTENGVFAHNESTNNSKLELDFNGEPDISDDPEDDPKGVGQSSVYKFDDVFRIENQGTQSVYANISEVTTHEGATTIRFYVRNESGDLRFITPSNYEAKIDVGTTVKVGVEIDTGEENDYTTEESSSGNTTITADASGDDDETTVENPQ